MRALGSIALDMCYVADGTLDGVIDTRGLVSGYDMKKIRRPVAKRETLYNILERY